MKNWRMVWVVETRHKNPKIGWLAVFASRERAFAWNIMRDRRLMNPSGKFRTVAYTRGKR